MESSPGTKRQIKYEKTSCYFCSEWLDSQSFKEHLIHCGQVLEKCPHSCNAYIQRLRMRSHLKDCPKVKKIMTNGYGEDQYLREHENRMLVLEQDVNALRSVLNEEIKQRLHLITDVGSLRKHNQISDEWTQKVGDVLTTLKKCINEETAARNSEMRKLEENATNLFSQYKLLHDGQSTSLTLLDQLHNKIIANENSAECLRDDVEQKEAVAAEKLEELGLEIETLQQEISHETSLLSRCLKDEVLRLENLIEQREEDLVIKLKSLEDAINRISSDLMSKFVSHTELNAKQMTLDYEVKSMKNIVCETEEKCEKLQKKLFEVENVLQKTHQGLVDLEVHLAYQKKFAAIENIRGHLIWKITDYSAKLNAAKQHGTMSQSPLFCNKQYGYTLRMDVHLDGIGTWKGRNIIACLNVVPGDWDTLLEWPCKLQADIILRDQSTNSEDAQDYVKATIVKKKNENYHSNQYIHIPHKIIDSRNFIRHDTIFFEVKVYRNKSGI